ncbi:S8 family serine peptidase [Arthrobacter sp. NEB 688]|uniref:S8 family peptidase n=1 Tax=Arthrobacter sp. NEB 688 TaxID=904039 RepID=UPI001565257C|nr:S8 family serine peptidase [Arthrobacter sp. NEB 688]QKE83771.1 S8 family serine peptidase [Arthrobacter sp. NEB 688]
MTRHTRSRRLAAATSAVAIGGALLAGSAAAAPTAPTAPAAPSAEAPSTPVPIVTPDGEVFSYVLNAKHANRGQTRLVSKAVAKAGGVVVQEWPQIGVVVAHSDRAAFRADVAKAAGRALDSVGATRTVPVSEVAPASTARSRAADDAQATRKDTDVESSSSRPVPTDPREVEQWDMQMIKADHAHDITDGSRKVLVGVLDSGIDADHPDLVANLDVRNSVNCSDSGRPSRTGWEPTTSDHGTHVAGTIAAARNGVGIVGVAPNVRMASVKVVNDDGFIYPEYAVCGFVEAGLKKMDVTNNSYYVDPFEFWCEDQPDQAAAKEAVRRAVTWSTKQGVVHAAAAGNSGKDLANKSSFQDTTSPNDGTPVTRTINSGCQDIPTELDGVVTVSSVERFPTDTLGSRLSSFSNRGLGVIDVAAPGSRILSTVVADNGYGLKSGTSMASPHVAGVLALMKSAHPSWKPAKMIEKLRQQADDKACSAATAGVPCVGPTRDNSYFGEGMVDALDAVS